MLKKRIIPKLQMRLSKVGCEEILTVVNTVNFDKYTIVGSPVSQAKIYQSQAADELIFLDIDSHLHSKEVLLDMIKAASEEIFMPMTVGGGVDSIDYIRELLRNGADKVSINTAAVENSQIITNASGYFGSQCVVVSIDYSKNNPNNENIVMTHGGTVKTDIDPVKWAKVVESLGAGEILLTSIDRDGMHNGLDLELISIISRSVSIPVIASGGCGKAKHFINGFLKGGADAIAAGGFFSYKDQNQMQTRAQMSNAGIPVRLNV